MSALNTQLKRSPICEPLRELQLQNLSSWDGIALPKQFFGW
jgi:hypothetical protein